MCSVKKEKKNSFFKYRIKNFNLVKYRQMSFDSFIHTLNSIKSNYPINWAEINYISVCAERRKFFATTFNENTGKSDSRKKEGFPELEPPPPLICIQDENITLSE